jgi:cyanate permease
MTMEIWAYIICAVIWLAIIFWWLVPVAKKHLTHEIYMSCGMGIYFSLIVLGSIWKNVDIGPLLYIGYGLIVIGIALIIPSFVYLKHKGKPESGWEHTTELIKTGIYGIVRHPFCLGCAIAMFGIMLVIQSVPSTILGLVAIFCFWMTSKKEDAYNIGKFGDEYRDYMKKVPMWNVFRRKLTWEVKPHG